MKAFPLSFQWDENHKQNNGMDLRDYFAAQAMQGMAGEHDDLNTMVEYAYAIADAMMEARK